MLTDVGARKTHSSQEVKYCSTRCRNTKPGPIDRKIEAAFAAILDGRPFEGSDGKEVEAAAIANDGNSKDSGKSKKKKVKGDSRRIIECGEVETAFFGHQTDPEKVFGRRKNRAARGVRERPEDWKSVDMVSDEETEPKRSTENEPEPDFTASDGSTVEEDHMAGGVVLNSAEGYGGGKIRPSQEKSDVNGSVGGEKGWAERIEETDEMKEKRREGQRRADEREMVRKAARRGCAFGFLVPEHHASGGKNRREGEGEGATNERRRKCEAIMKGTAVEASYAKGEWGIRWREER